tara:strand:- start:287 stop:1069 length:783 start_codon:yes stop_codon:yes gene_type:complete
MTTNPDRVNFSSNSLNAGSSEFGWEDAHHLALVAAENKIRRKSGKMVSLLAIPFLLLAGFVIFCNLLVSLSTQDKVFRSPDEVPENAVGVVLGTSKNVGPNRPNAHFTTRVNAAAELFKMGKVQHLLVSGSNNSRYYNEPKDMQTALGKLGVPDTAITQDESGFRTLDSVVRANKIFGQEHYTIITDDFHVTRAVFLASHHKHHVVGFAAPGVDVHQSAKSRIREVFARVKAVLDVYVFDTQPREMGVPAPIKVAGTPEA